MSVDRSILVEDAAMSVGGVLAKADIASDVESRVKLFQLFYGEDYGALRVVRGSSNWVL